jgi:hypothetical protein
MKVRICDTGGEITFGLALQFASCGCKHLDVLFGWYYLRIDFGQCRDYLL